MLKNLSKTVCRKIEFIVFILVLLIQISSCKTAKGDTKIARTETFNFNEKNPSLIRVVALSGHIIFANKKITKGENLKGVGTLRAVGKSSWVDIEYLGGEKVRLKNGSVELKFGEESTSNLGGLDIDIGNASKGTNTRIIKLKSGKLFAYISKFEQLRKIKYYFSTDVIYLNLMHGSFVLNTDKNVTQLSLCEGSISIGPSYGIESSRRPTWGEVNLSEGNTVFVNLTETPKPTELSKPKKDEIAKEFRAMGMPSCH